MSTISTVTLGGSGYLLQHTLGDLHVLHGDDLAEFPQGVNVADLIHELHTAENINTTQLLPQAILPESCRHQITSLWHDFAIYLLSSLWWLDFLREVLLRPTDHKDILTWWKVLRWPGRSGWTMLGERWWDTLDSSSVCRGHWDIQVFGIVLFNMSFPTIILTPWIPFYQHYLHL